ncbi:hypothetical protein [Rhizobium sp. PL01]|uniref:hypothetical protein n=1 Tax=Rhizobium sp. PL01 TaxID=3085631 RepID=UPI0029822B6D|nr:hypothetical protein [Rhizobium sp. PL01]MDW5313346.1 hypothetical protein [Rhizobium sp. PL01]
MNVSAALEKYCLKGSNGETDAFIKSKSSSLANFWYISCFNELVLYLHKVCRLPAGDHQACVSGCKH